MTDTSNIRDTWAQLGALEKQVLCVLADRLLKGQAQYGALNLRDDKRDWRKERAEELADAMIYDAIEEVSRSLT